MRLLTDIPTKRVYVDEEFPEYIELGIQMASLRMRDASVYQDVARNLSKVVLGAQPGEYPKTQGQAAECYAYSRYLMGIDDYWLSMPNRLIKERTEFRYYRAGEQAAPLPMPAPDE